MTPLLPSHRSMRLSKYSSPNTTVTSQIPQELLLATKIPIMRTNYAFINFAKPPPDNQIFTSYLDSCPVFVRFNALISSTTTIIKLRVLFINDYVVVIAEELKGWRQIVAESRFGEDRKGGCNS